MLKPIHKNQRQLLTSFTETMIGTLQKSAMHDMQTVENLKTHTRREYIYPFMKVWTNPRIFMNDHNDWTFNSY